MAKKNTRGLDFARAQKRVVEHLQAAGEEGLSYSDLFEFTKTFLSDEQCAASIYKSRNHLLQSLLSNSETTHRKLKVDIQWQGDSTKRRYRVVPYKPLAQSPTSVQIGGKKYTLPFADFLRPLTDGERQALAASIRASGVVAPVIVDENNAVIDGGNRMQIAAEMGLDRVPVEVRCGLSEEQKTDLAAALNDARRHLTPHDRRQLAADREERIERIKRVVAARQDGASLRTIAEQEGVSLGQVQRDLGEAATVSPDTVQPKGGKVKGKDGKNRPAQRARPAKQTAVPSEPLPSAPTVDGAAELPPMPEPAPPPSTPSTPSTAPRVEDNSVASTPAEPNAQAVEAPPIAEGAHSEWLDYQLNLAGGRSLIIEKDLAAKLAEPAGWDWSLVRDVLVRRLDEVLNRFDEIRSAVVSAAQQQP